MKGNIESTLSNKKTGYKTTIQSSNENVNICTRTQRPILSVYSFDYKSAKPRPIETTILEGKFKRKIGNKYNKECDTEITYRHRKKVLNTSNNSDSRRTLIPSLNTETERKINPKPNFNKESKGFAYISKIDIISPKKKTNPKIYESQCFDYKKNPKKPFCLTKKPKCQFLRYSTTTQIVHLPGGLKRDANDIRDDDIPLRKNFSSISFKRREKNDINSNISCLPGCRINTISQTFRKFSGQKNLSSIEYERNLSNDKSKNMYGKYRAAGRLRKINEGKGKKYINLKQWKKDYYQKLGNLFNHINTGNIKLKRYGNYKNQSHFDFM